MGRFQRNLKGKEKKRTVLVFCEGRVTEPAYFQALRNEQIVRDNFAVTIGEGRGGGPLGVVQFALKKLTEEKHKGKVFEEVWCVLDVESEEGMGAQPFAQAIKLAQDHNIKLIWSNPCFERWYLSHFENSMGPIRDCDALIEQLDKYWIKHRGAKYEKSDASVYEILRPLQQTALENAESALTEHQNRGRTILDANSATQVQVVVKHLLGRK